MLFFFMSHDKEVNPDYSVNLYNGKILIEVRIIRSIKERMSWS